MSVVLRADFSLGSNTDLTSKAILFPAHKSIIDLAAIFANEMKERRGIDSVVLVQGSKDTLHARQKNVFSEIVNLVADLRMSEAEANCLRNIQRLTAFEKTHGSPTFWPAILQDPRWGLKQYSYAELLQYLRHSLDMVESVLSRWDIIAVVGQLTSPAYRILSRACEDVCPYLAPMTTRFFHRFYFDDDFYYPWEECLRTYRKFMREGVPAKVEVLIDPILKGIRQSRVRPAHFEIETRNAAQNSGLRRVRGAVWANDAKSIWHDNVIDGYKNPNRMHWTYTLPPRKIARWAQWKYRRWYYHQNALQRIPEKGRFALFLPNAQPEYSIDVQGWPFVDQASLIRTIAQSLPVDMLLLVKEHPLMVGPRSVEFYRRVLKLPNVRLVSEQINSQDLLGTCDLVFTITGTVALEAICFGVPVIMFGRVFLNELQGVRVVRDLFSLPGEVNLALKGTNVDFDKSARAALAAMHVCSYPGRLDIHLLEPDEVPPENQTLLGAALDTELQRRGLLTGAAVGQPLARAYTNSVD